MSQASNQNSSEKCKNCETFFACAAFKGFCSKCYKDLGGATDEKEHNDCSKTAVSNEDRELVN